MNVSNKKLHILGRRASENTAQATFPERMTSQRQRFVNQYHPPARRPLIRPILVIGTAVAAVLTLLAINPFQAEKIPFWIGPNGTIGEQGSWVEATSEQQTVIRFEGGSTFKLNPNSAARVIEANVKQTIVDLTEGEIHCSVEGNGKTRWIVRAGTYRVVVTGTEFTVRWTPFVSKLSVDVTEGKVLVFGEPLNEHGVALAMGDRLKVDTDEISITKRNANFPDPSQAAPSEGHSNVTPAAPTEEATKTKSSQKKTSKNPRQEYERNTIEWKNLYAQKDYAGAMAVAKAQGVDKLAKRLNADDLWKLSKAARFAKDGAVANKLLHAMTTRFPGTPKAHNAVFLQGRVNEELLKNAGAAKHSYEQYLSLVPNGALSAEALGRLFGVCQRAGFHSKAQKYAQTYLQKYPQGSFAQRAHSVLE